MEKFSSSGISELTCRRRVLVRNKCPQTSALRPPPSDLRPPPAPLPSSFRVFSVFRGLFFLGFKPRITRITRKSEISNLKYEIQNPLCPMAPSSPLQALRSKWTWGGNGPKSQRNVIPFWGSARAKRRPAIYPVAVPTAPSKHTA